MSVLLSHSPLYFCDQFRLTGWSAMDPSAPASPMSGWSCSTWMLRSELPSPEGNNYGIPEDRIP